MDIYESMSINSMYSDPFRSMSLLIKCTCFDINILNEAQDSLNCFILRSVLQELA